MWNMFVCNCVFTVIGGKIVQRVRALRIASQVGHHASSAYAAGGRGGSIAAYDTYLGVINTTFVGSTASSHAASASSVAGHTARERKTAINGGCMALESATLLISGSSFSRCNAQSNGGAISMRAVTSVIRDSAFASSSADSVRFKLLGIATRTLLCCS